MADTPVSVFISYSRIDSAFIDRLEADLRAYGFDTWVDRQHLEGGADWARQIEQQIARCEALIVALSPDAITSTWVRREITFALNAGKHIIPIIARPVASTPIEIVNLQYIDLSADYTPALQDLRVALLNVRTLPPPPRPAQAPQPLLTLPDVSDPLKGLVQIPAPPPAPNPDLNAKFMQAQLALGHGNLDLAEALLRQIVEQEEGFGNGLAAEELQRVREELEPLHLSRLQTMADEAHASGAWGQEIGALRALLARQEATGGNRFEIASLRHRLLRAEDCQKWEWLYVNARAFAQANDDAATAVALTRLWEKVPAYGDPLHIAPPNVQPPSLQSSDRFNAVLPAPDQDSRNPNAVLICTAGVESNIHKMYLLKSDRTTIGRHRDSDIFLLDLAVARLNSTVTRSSSGAYIIRDENSANGTFVNGFSIIEHALRDGDVIRVGQTDLEFHLRYKPTNSDSGVENTEHPEHPEDGGKNIFRIFRN